MTVPDSTTSPDPAGIRKKPIDRRNVLRLLGAAGVIGAVLYLSFGTDRKLKAVHHSRPLMGTLVNLTVCGPDEQQCREAITACLSRMETLSDMMSTYVADSPISRLNRNGILHNAPREMLEVFQLSLELGKLTGGAFDPTVMPLVQRFKEVKTTGVLPDKAVIKDILQLVDYRHIIVEDERTIRFGRPGVQATLDGIAKGYIVDQAAEVLKRHGIENTFVEAGGDLVTLGSRADGRPWRIGIRNPRNDDLTRMTAIEMQDRAIATSGDYMQYFTEDKKIHHIINPSTGFSPIETASSSILAPSLAWADGLATATMVLGPKKSLQLIDTLPDCEGFFIDKHLSKYQTEGFFKQT